MEKVRITFTQPLKGHLRSFIAEALEQDGLPVVDSGEDYFVVEVEEPLDAVVEDEIFGLEDEIFDFADIGVRIKSVTRE